MAQNKGKTCNQPRISHPVTVKLDANFKGYKTNLDFIICILPSSSGIFLPGGCNLLCPAPFTGDYIYSPLHHRNDTGLNLLTRARDVTVAKQIIRRAGYGSVNRPSGVSSAMQRNAISATPRAGFRFLGECWEMHNTKSIFLRWLSIFAVPSHKYQCAHREGALVMSVAGNSCCGTWRQQRLGYSKTLCYKMHNNSPV